MVILGLHKDPWHNTGATMIRAESAQFEVVNMAEERCNREKDSRKFPRMSIQACMQELGVDSLEQIDCVIMDYIVNRNWKVDTLDKNSTPNSMLLEFAESKIHVINHHLAHAYATYYSSGFEQAAILVVDGRGSKKETQSLYVAKEKIEFIESTDKIGIGLLYAAVTQYIGFELFQEGKTMGLASYGAKGKSILNLKGAWKGIVTDYSKYCVPGSYDLKLGSIALESMEDRAQAAFDVQKECEAAMLHLAEYAKNKTGMEHLCISGGVGLNSVANHKIHQSGLFNDIFINPAASDTGIALGCALYGYYNLYQGEHVCGKISPYIGVSYNQSRIEKAVRERDGYTIIDEGVLPKTIDMLCENKIISHFYGRSEMGPRALGNRSILMSPLCIENKDVLNARVKFREPFRPFAPAVLSEYMEEYFEFDRATPYMLMVSKVRPDKQSIIPAVTHVDGTARLQTVENTGDCRLYELISGFYHSTGVPVLLNTSFNINGQPIVETPEDAVDCFLATNIDAMLIEHLLLVKHEL